jgi:hypothetical protein
VQHATSEWKTTKMLIKKRNSFYINVYLYCPPSLAPPNRDYHRPFFRYLKSSEGENTAITYDSTSNSPALYFSWHYSFQLHYYNSQTNGRDEDCINIKKLA